MAQIPPSVRHMLLCDNVQPNANNPRKVNAFGLLSSAIAETFPFRLTFAVYAVFTGGRGSGQCQLVVESEDDGEEIYVGKLHPLTFDPDPLALQGAVFRIASCEFP